MADINCYLKELDVQRDKLANILTEKGIPSEESEKYNSLVEKVGQLKVGADNIPYTASVVGQAMMPYKIGLAINNGWTYSQENNDNYKTTSTVTITTVKSCFLIAAAMHRSTISIVGDGWEQIVTSKAADGYQYITAWGKMVDAGTYTITTTQTSNVRMSLKALALYDVSKATVVDNVLMSSRTYTPTPTTGKKRLYLLSAVSLYDTSKDFVEVDSASASFLASARELRFSVYFDAFPENGITPTFIYQSSSYSSNSMNEITLDIE